MIKVGIQIDDNRFAAAFSKGLAKVSKSMMFFLLDNLQQGEACDLILSFDGGRESGVIGLTRDPGEENIYAAPPYRIFCYKDSRMLLKDLLFLYYKISGRNMELTGDCQCRLLAFVATGGGCGCTSMALSVGRALYKLYGCKCLYLNLCPINDSKRYLQEESQKSLLNLLYYLDCEKDFPIGSFIATAQDIDYINTDVMNTWVDEFHQPLLARLMHRIEQLKEYDFLILDMSNHLSACNKKILQQVDAVVLLRQWQETPSEPYFRQLLNQLEKMTGAAILETDALYLQEERGSTIIEYETRRLVKEIMEEGSL